MFDIQLVPIFLALLGLALTVCHSLTQNKTKNRNLSVQLHMYVAHFCLAGHIHTMLTGGLLVLKPMHIVTMQLGDTPGEFYHGIDTTKYNDTQKLALSGCEKVFK